MHLFFPALLYACAPGNDSATWESLDAYFESIDYSCTTVDDCTIKDIHGCGGYYPACVNQDAVTDPNFVEQICEEEGLGGVSGYPSIDGCACTESRCEGTSSGE